MRPMCRCRGWQKGDVGKIFRMTSSLRKMHQFNCCGAIFNKIAVSEGDSASDF